MKRRYRSLLARPVISSDASGDHIRRFQPRFAPLLPASSTFDHRHRRLGFGGKGKAFAVVHNVGLIFCIAISSLPGLALASGVQAPPDPVELLPPGKEGPLAPTPNPPQSVEPKKTDELVEQALKHWTDGEWASSRAIWELLVASGQVDGDSVALERALRYLADATLFDTSLPEKSRQDLARAYIKKLYSTFENWNPPPSTHGEAFYRLVNEIGEQLRREAATAADAECEAHRLACVADLHEKKIDYSKLEESFVELEEEHRKELVPVVTEQHRSRAIALLPAGVGHFYNQKPTLGWIFLSAETLLGATGLGFILHRRLVMGCSRKTFQNDPVICTPNDGFKERAGVKDPNLPTQSEVEDLEGRVERIRQSEEIVGWVLLGTVVTDIVLSQVLFRRQRFVSERQVPREELERDLKPSERETSRNERSAPRAKLQVRPGPAFMRQGAGLSLYFRF